MARSFNVPAERVMYKKDLRAAMQRMLDSDQPFLLDVICPYTEHVTPVHPGQPHGGGHGLLNETRTGPHRPRPPPRPAGRSGPLASGAEINFDFAQFQTGRLPDGFLSLVSGPGPPGDWKVMDVTVPPAMPPS